MMRHERIRRALKRSKKTPAEVARLAGCTEDYVRKILRGQMPLYKMHTVEAIERAVGIRP